VALSSTASTRMAPSLTAGRVVQAVTATCLKDQPASADVFTLMLMGSPSNARTRGVRL
jgi:hypothetical protein